MTPPWGPERPRVAVLGATGAVGREMIRTLEERGFPLASLAAFATERSAGTRLRFRGEDLIVRPTGQDWWRGVDIALSSCGTAAARELLPPAAAGGTVCIDNSSAFRMDASVPLVIPEINAETLAGHRGIVANPNCTAITALMALGPLHRAFGLAFLVTSSYQSVSGAGMKGIRELAEQVEKLHGQEEDIGPRDPAALPPGEVFPRTIAFNVVPVCERFDPAGSGSTTEEIKMGDETRKILGLPDLPVAATAVRVPVPVGHGVSVYARFDRPAGPAEARAALAAAPGVVLVDDPSNGEFPTPAEAAGRDEVLVGRVRRAADDPRALLFFVAGDNLRKGAALNAVQIAEALAEV